MKDTVFIIALVIASIVIVFLLRQILAQKVQISRIARAIRFQFQLGLEEGLRRAQMTPSEAEKAAYIQGIRDCSEATQSKEES